MFAHDRVKVTLTAVEHLADTCNAAVLACTSSTFDCRLTICQVPRKAVNKQGRAKTSAAELLLLPWFCNSNAGSQTESILIVQQVKLDHILRWQQFTLPADVGTTVELEKQQLSVCRHLHDGELEVAVFLPLVLQAASRVLVFENITS